MAKITVAVIRVDGTAELARIEPDDVLFLHEQLGGYAEAIATPDGCIMFVNDAGDRDGLAVNDLASALVPGYGAQLGTVVLAGPARGEDVTDLPAHWIERLGL
jgi:hypothetical protein